MGTFSIWHWVIVLAVVLILFGGKGKIPSLMGDFAKGIKSFKSGLKEEDKKAEDTGSDDPKAAVTSESVAEEPVKQESSAKG
jgi:sec-independent protein translocase protein TatA